MTVRRSRDIRAHTPDARAAATVSAAPLSAHALEQRLGHVFARPELLELALTHRSFTYEAGTYEAGSGASAPERDGASAGPSQAAHGKVRRNKPGTDNEQLEFLGDAILGLCVAEALYREFPQCTEGELTRMRAALVSRARMAEMGAALGLGKHLRLGRSAEQNGGRQKPALLANAAEAVIAAVYLDAASAGFDAVCRLVEQHLLAPERDAMRSALARDSGRGALRDHKTLLQERVQATGAGRLRYLDVSQSGPAHQRTFAVQALVEAEAGTRVLAEAEGSSKKEAQQRAAELALSAWDRKKDGETKSEDENGEDAKGRDAKSEDAAAADPSAGSAASSIGRRAKGGA